MAAPTKSTKKVGRSGANRFARYDAGQRIKMLHLHWRARDRNQRPVKVECNAHFSSHSSKISRKHVSQLRNKFWSKIEANSDLTTFTVARRLRNLGDFPRCKMSLMAHRVISWQRSKLSLSGVKRTSTETTSRQGRSRYWWVPTAVLSTHSITILRTREAGSGHQRPLRAAMDCAGEGPLAG
jgi:hypothetical protein